MADAATSTPSNTRGQAGQGGSDVADRTKDVARSAQDEGRAVVDEAVAQTRNVVDEARSRLMDQAEEQADRAAESIRRFNQEIRALTEGRPEEAETARRYLDEVSGRLDHLASRVSERGLSGLTDDLSRFARRRPGAFLAGAAATGFLVGRLLRSSSGNGTGAGRQDDQTGQVGTAITAAPAQQTVDLTEEEEVPYG